MTSVDRDVLAVRELADEAAAHLRRTGADREPSLARVWHHMADAPPARRAARWRHAAPVAAGLAVLMVVAAGLWAVGSGGSGGGPSTFAGPAGSRPVPVDQAWAQIIAAGGATPAVTPGSNQVIHVRSVGEGGIIAPGEWQYQRQNRDSWYDPRGMRPVLIVDDDRGTIVRDTAGGDGPPPSLTDPYPGWLADLSTVRGVLGPMLLAQSENVRGAWSDRNGLWEAMAYLFTRADLVLPPAVRVAMYEVLAEEDGLTAAELTVADRSVIAITRTEREHGIQLYFDPTTGRCVGRASLYFGHDGPGTPRDSLTSWSLWTQSIVDRANIP